MAYYPDEGSHPKDDVITVLFHHPVHGQQDGLRGIPAGSQ
jgi:hypothetical protein